MPRYSHKGWSGFWIYCSTFRYQISQLGIRNIVYIRFKVGQHLCDFLGCISVEEAALGCYLSLHQDLLSKTEMLFIKPGSKKSTTSKTFGRQIGKIAKRYYDQVKYFVMLSHFSSYSNCCKI